MDPANIIQIILAVAKTTEGLAALVEEVHDTMSTDQAGEVQAALDRITAANDQLHERVQRKLKAAAQR